MGEFIDAVFVAANALSTGILLFVLAYWLIVIFGFLGTDFLDFDIDADLDVDADVDADIDSGSGDLSWINQILTFFNLGKIPFMVWLSFLSFPLWFINVNINNFLGIENFFVGLITFLLAAIPSLFIAKFATWPFVGFFERMDKDSKPKSIVGKVGSVIIPADHDSKGQAEVNYEGSFLRFLYTYKNLISKL